MTKETGGPAFPTVPYTAPSGDFTWGEDGITARDYFAAQALNGMTCYLRPQTTRISESDCKCIAEQAYQLADAMIAERNKE